MLVAVSVSDDADGCGQLVEDPYLLGRQPHWVAAAFSRIRSMRRVPGMGTTHGACSNTQASAI